MFVCMWIEMKLSAYVAEIYEVQKQAGGQAEEHCLLGQNEQQGPLNTPKHSKYELHAGWMEEEEACMQRAGCSALTYQLVLILTTQQLTV